jgi:hypothetical protein
MSKLLPNRLFRLLMGCRMGPREEIEHAVQTALHQPERELSERQRVVLEAVSLWWRDTASVSNLAELDAYISQLECE